MHIGDHAYVDIAVAGDVAGGIHRHRHDAPPMPLPPIPLPPLDEAHTLLVNLPRDSIPEPSTLPTPHRMPYVRNELFVRRDGELRALAADLAEQRTVVVTTGMGGVGKTQLALELAYCCGRYFAGGVFWVSCADVNYKGAVYSFPRGAIILPA